jgi:hypothetical protein
LPAGQRSYDWTIPSVTTTAAAVRVIAEDLSGNTAGLKSGSFTIEPGVPVDTTPPTVLFVNLTPPVNGQHYVPGERVTINWDATDNVGLEGFSLLFLPQGVQPGEPIVSSLPAFQRSYSWTIPNVTTTAGAVRLIAEDLAGNTAGLKSASFTIKPAMPVDTIPPMVLSVNLTPPANGQHYVPGERVTINWDATDSVGLRAFSLLFLPQGVQPGEPIVSGLPAGQRSYSWTIPNLSTTTGAVRLIAEDLSGNTAGLKSASFTIKPAMPVDTIPPTGPSRV